MNHITLAVRDIDVSFHFYRDVLGLRPLVKWDRGAYFLVGAERPQENDLWFCLNVDENRKPNHCYTHYAFHVNESDFETLAAKIICLGASIFQENRSPGKSLYFLDPDAHKLEIHTETWQMRTQLKKIDPGHWQDVEWFI